MKRSILVRKFIPLLLVGLISGCTHNSSYEVSEYEYAMIHTSKSNNESIIDTYNVDGDHLNSYEIAIGGLTGGAFMKEPVLDQDNIYIASPVFGSKSQKFITQINTNDFSLNELKSEKPPTTFTIDENFAYLGSSLTTGFYISKVSKTENNIMHTITLDGIGNYLISDDSYIYAISKSNVDNDRDITISYLSKEDLTVVQQVNISDVIDVQCATIDGKVMYLSAVLEKDNHETNSLIILDIETKINKKVAIPFKETYNVIIDTDNIFIVENNGSKVLKYNHAANSETVFELENKNLCSVLKNKTIYSSDGNRVFLYDATNLNLLKSFEIQKQEDMRFVSFYIK